MLYYLNIIQTTTAKTNKGKTNMSSFIDDVKNMLNSTKTLTENGATAYTTSGSKLLDINFAVSGLRSATEKEIEDYFIKAYFENPTLAVVWLFFARDIRGGMGERHIFRVCLKWLAVNKPDVVEKILHLIPEYGRYDDLFDIVEISGIGDKAIDFICQKFVEDVELNNAGKPISLLAKWMPSINTSSSKTRALAKKFINALGMDERTYRKTLAQLRTSSCVIESMISSNKWDCVNYEHVPSQANLKYKNAFIKHDAVRRQEFINKLVKGEAKINASTVFPHDIFSKYIASGGNTYYGNSVSKYDDTYEEMWKALPDYVKNVDNGNTICVVDGSGSMLTNIGNSSVTAEDVAQALGLYFAERMSDSPFKNKFITFSHRPQLIDLSKCSTLMDKINLIGQYTECANTNIEATLDLLLETAKKNHTPQKDIPNLLILSDMQFDAMVDIGDRYYVSNFSAAKLALMEKIEKRWNAAGYKLPRITYWNIMGGRGRQTTVPVQQSECGVALVSGFSPAIASMIYSCKLDPYEVLVEKLESERYQPIFEAIA